MLKLVPADIGIVARYLAAHPSPLPLPVYVHYAREALAGRVYAAHAADMTATPQALGGVLDIGWDQPGFCWLSVLPGGLGSDLPSLVRFARAVIRREARSFPAGIVCNVRAGNAQGARLARVLGFSQSARRVGDLIEWEWVDVRHGRRSHRGSSAETSGAGAGRAA